MARFLDSLGQGTVNELKGNSPFSSSPMDMSCHSNPIALPREPSLLGRKKRMKASDTIDVNSVHNCFQLLKIIRYLYSGPYNLT